MSVLFKYICINVTARSLKLSAIMTFNENVRLTVLPSDQNISQMFFDM